MEAYKKMFLLKYTKNVSMNATKKYVSMEAIKNKFL